jgi:hypothetical protein
MFDYSAGEKFRLTLIMIAVAGFMAGVFLTMMLMPQPEPVRRRSARLNNSEYPAQPPQAAYAPSSAPPQAPQAELTDPMQAKSLIESWLPYAWDLSAGSASQSQEKAIAYMTPDVANSYRQNVWTPDIAKQIDESGVKSEFKASQVAVGAHQADGAVVIMVEGTQVLAVPGKGASNRSVKLEYLVRNTAEGMRIAGISEGGKKS